MHTDLLRALAQARHEDLLNTHPPRGQPRVRPNGRPRLISRSRQRVGSLLIRAGTRVSGDRRSALELAHE